VLRRDRGEVAQRTCRWDVFLRMWCREAEARVETPYVRIDYVGHIFCSQVCPGSYFVSMVELEVVLVPVVQFVWQGPLFRAWGPFVSVVELELSTGGAGSCGSARSSCKVLYPELGSHKLSIVAW
jgi:hypothetical protein